MNLAMNSAMNNAMHAAGNVAGNPAPAAAAVATGAVAPDAQTLPAGAVSGQAPAALPAASLPFGHWIALDGAVPDTATDAAAPQDGVVATPGADAGEIDATLEATLEETRVPDVLLAAMAPLMAPAAMPAMMLAMPGATPGAVNDAADDAASASANGVAPAAGVQVAGARAALPAVDVLPAAAPATPLPAAQAAIQAASVTAPAARLDAGAAPAVAAQPNAAAAPAPGESAADALADAAPVSAGTGVNAASGQPANARGADSIVLAGPPTAWRQNLHEALGERLQLQLGRNIEQATIRLEPPMLGRIDIAIRHSSGNLEIHIAASNSDVLRQLNTVSDSLRSDLAGRQYSSVSVNVTEVPRMQASAQPGGYTPGQGNTDSQGRPRQEQARTPGRALGEDAAAGAPLFSMN